MPFSLDGSQIEAMAGILREVTGAAYLARLRDGASRLRMMADIVPESVTKRQYGEMVRREADALEARVERMGS